MAVTHFALPGHPGAFPQLHHPCRTAHVAALGKFAISQHDIGTQLLNSILYDIVQMVGWCLAAEKWSSVAYEGFWALSEVFKSHGSSAARWTNTRRQVAKTLCQKDYYSNCKAEAIAFDDSARAAWEEAEKFTLLMDPLRYDEPMMTSPPSNAFVCCLSAI